MGTLAVDVGNAAAIRAALRRAVGYGTDTVLVTDAACDDAIREALRRVNTMRPAIGVGTFTTVADQQTYTPLPSGAYGIRNVYWPREATCAGQALGGNAAYAGLLGDLDAYLGQPIDEDGTRTIIDPAAVMQLARSATWLRRMLGGATVVRDRSTVYLIPTPTTAVTVVFTYHGPRFTTAGDIGDEDAGAFWAAAEVHMHRMLAAGAGGVSQVQDTTEGTSITLKSPEHHMKLADLRQRDFNAAQVPVCMTTFP